MCKHMRVVLKVLVLSVDCDDLFVCKKQALAQIQTGVFYNFLKIFETVLSLIDHAVLKNVDFYHLEPVKCEELRTPRDQRFHTDSPAIEHSSGRWERKQVDQSEDAFFLHWSVLPEVLYFFILHLSFVEIGCVEM